MTIPSLQNGELPPDEHHASLDEIEADSRLPCPKYFQVNRDGEPKGILVVTLGDST